MRILALGCHPDDIEFGCGGTLIKYADAGHEIYMMVMTEGQAGGESATRREEQEAASELLGCKKLFWGGYGDTELALSREIIQRVEEVIDKIEPAFIFVPHGDAGAYQGTRSRGTLHRRPPSDIFRCTRAEFGGR